jgi:two-component sensor histidine kinase
VTSWWQRLAGLRVELGWPASISLTLICVALATVLRMIVGELLGPTLPFATYFPAVLGAALWGGFWSGLITIALSIVIAWLAILPPAFEFNSLTVTDTANFALFAASSLLIVWLALVHRRVVRRLEEQEKGRALLVGEVQHRGRNILTVVEMLVRQTIDDQEKGATLINRIRAIASTQEFFDASDNRTMELRDLFSEELLPYDSQFALTGPPVQLTPTLARNLRLVFHEMATNALKHGALSNTEGRVAIDWKLEQEQVEINWREIDGPKTSPPTNYNFGSRLITRTLRQLNASFEPTFAQSGYCYRLVVPLRD